MNYFTVKGGESVTNEALVMDYQNGNHTALDELIIKNKGLVHHFANIYHGLCNHSFVDRDDLVQEGFIGLMNAAKQYDPAVPINQEEVDKVDKKTVLFSSYASRAIQGRIFRIAQKYIPREKKSDTYSQQIHVNSIHDFIPGSENTTWEEVIPFEKKVFQDVDREIDNEILKKDLFELLDAVFGEEFTVDLKNKGEVPNMEAFSERINQGITAKEVLLLHYGLFGKKMTFTQISECVKLSVERLSVIELKALHSIRNSDYIYKLIERYGDEFGITVDDWKEVITSKQIIKTVAENIETIDDLLNSFFTRKVGETA